MGEALNIRLAPVYGSLSAKLQRAADYVVAHPVNTATRPLRALAHESGVAPATFSRLAKALEYDSFDALRDVIRISIGRQVDSFATRAERLEAEHGSGESDFTSVYMDACIDNIRSLGAQIDRDQLNETVQRLSTARKVVSLGALGSANVAEYMAYMASFITDNWRLAGHAGSSLGSTLVGMGERDAIVIITKPPFVPRVLNAAKLAHERGIYVVVISDTHTCQALQYASSGFIVPTNTPHFFSSYTATIFLVETIIGKLAAQAGSSERIAIIEQHNRRLQEACDGTNLN